MLSLSQLTYNELTSAIHSFDPASTFHFSALPTGKSVSPFILTALASHTSFKWPSLPFAFAVEEYKEGRNGTPEYFPHLHFVVQCSEVQAAEVCSFLRSHRASPRLHQRGSVHYRPIEGAAHLHHLPGYWAKDIATFYSSFPVNDPDEWTTTDTSGPLPF